MTSMKICKRCRRNLPLDAYGRRSASEDGIHFYCKECVRVLFKESQARNKDKRKQYANDNYIKRQTDLSAKEYDTILRTQNYRCKMCYSNTPGQLNASHTLFRADRDLRTGQLLGLICDRCKEVLRHLSTNTNLQQVAAYLQRKHDVTVGITSAKYLM